MLSYAHLAHSTNELMFTTTYVLGSEASGFLVGSNCLRVSKRVVQFEQWVRTRSNIVRFPVTLKCSFFNSSAAKMPSHEDSILLPKPVIDSCYASIFRCYQEMFPSSFASKTALTKKLSVQYDLSLHKLKPLADDSPTSQFVRSPRNSPRSSLRESKSRNPIQMMASLRRSFR